MYTEFGIKKDLLELAKEVENEIKPQFEKIENIKELNSLKVLNAFQKSRLSEMHLHSSTGYGIDEVGRNKIEEIYAKIFNTEDALVRAQLISGTHALAVTLFGLLRPGDTMISISGIPYDTLQTVIGISKEQSRSSLKEFGIKYEQIELINDDFDIALVKERVSKNNVKLIEIQRSRGYSTRKSLTIDKIERVIKAIREVDKDVIIMIDNCYCEFVSKREPLEVGADVIVGSLIKNLGGGIAPNGAYIAGRKDLVELAAERLTVPGEGKGVGPTLGINRSLLQGLFLAPSVVKASIKTAILTSKVMEMLGYKVEPRFDAERVDIVQTIEFGDREKLIKYCQGIQAGSPVDSDSLPEPCDTPGYQDQIIMASGSFTQGSSIELSCDGPLRAPFVGFQQGALTYEYGKLGLIKAIAQ